MNIFSHLRYLKVHWYFELTAQLGKQDVALKELGLICFGIKGIDFLVLDTNYKETTMKSLILAQDER